MNGDLLLPIISSAACLILVGSSLASFRLGSGRMLKLALVWLAIFAGAYAFTEWFMFAQGTAAALM
ncbi:MAG: hypothetical protein ACKO1N_12070 [Erythrobacter sp.]